ncbi:GNAT family N-acetyltransferase [Fortiea sp. LEGE XX443]|uniref:GNAT family N-acetyltransferase n=1 Tax=Fortiea sp. LEGE XX443 TaxID=1828611 RepID=UPI0018821EFF|nr:GNAT family N-acetyltransferase [Fortiea sp. LEGE XX443]MBE9004499.1 GNAT family N-acetyltransferase [Fortiea sp. LEGE XX443]
MNINFKPGENNDVETLLILIQNFYELDGCVSFNAVVLRSALSQLLSDESMGRVWLIQDHNQTIGYVILTFGYSLEYGGRDAFIDELYIEPAYHGQGIGKQIIKFLEEVCIFLNVQALHLEVERENTSAQGFYRRVGFKDHNRYLMTKWLNKTNLQ